MKNTIDHFLNIYMITIILIFPGCIALRNMTRITEFHVEGSKLYMQGEINSKTLEQFEEIYSEYPNIDTLIELTVTGSIDDETMIALAYRIRELRINTHLTADSRIYSGAVDLFLAGVKRTMETGAIIGVHSWSDGMHDASDYPLESPEHELNRFYVEQMLGDDAFYWFTIYAAPADDIYIMTEEDVTKFGLLTE